MRRRLVRAFYPGRLALAGMLAAIALFQPLDCNAQSVAAPEFEVASIKPQPWTGNGAVGIVTRGDTFDAEHVSLFDLVMFAYDMREAQISGGPAWVRKLVLADSELFQVIAKAPGDAPTPEADFRRMLQALLADRFKLRVHRGHEELKVYNLVVDRAGPKMKESEADTHPNFVTSSIGSYGISIKATHMTMTELIEHQLRLYSDRPIFDKTGLAASYDLTLEFAVRDVAEIPAPGQEAGISGGPPLAAAVRSLGLNLEPGKAMFDTIVIDHAERPAAD
jgi:uncharacterized protein (TIGR03435 family)